MSKFKVGDRVVVDHLIEEDYENCDERFVMSTIGTIVYKYPSTTNYDCLYEVQFDKFINGGDGNGYGLDGYCLPLYESQLNNCIQIDENQINSFLN